MFKMYKGIPFSPQVALADSIGAGDTIIKVTDITAFPDAPNYATIGTDEAGETILYAAKTTDSLSGCTRGIEGEAKAWPAGTTIARNFTNKDFEAMQENIRANHTAAGNAQTTADDARNAALLKSGGTMTGAITMGGNKVTGLGTPTANTDAVTKEYADNMLPKTGGTMTGAIAMGKNKVTGLGSPTDTEDAANKGYVDAIVNKIYPVGSVYISVADTSPAVLFGGSWERLKDQFLLGAGDTYSAGSTGGESEHTLTQNEMPKHFHGAYLLGMGGTDTTPAYYAALNQSAYTYNYGQGVSGVLEAATVGFKGGELPHNNMPPYLAVYMWKRVA